MTPPVWNLEKGEVSDRADAEPVSTKSVSLVAVPEGLDRTTGGTTLPEASSRNKAVGNPGSRQAVDEMLVKVIPSKAFDMPGKSSQN